MNTNIDIIEEMSRKMYPGLWEKCYPRVYDQLGNFHSPRIVAAALANAVVGVINRDKVEQYALNHFLYACAVDRHDVPTFFVPREVLEAVDQTALPEEMKWTEMHMPHPGLVFVFEKGSVVRGKEGQVGYVGLARYKTGEVVRHSYRPESFPEEVTMRSGLLIMTTCSHEEKLLPTYDLTLNERTSPLVADVVNANHWYVAPEERDEVQTSMTVEDARFNQWLLVLAVKLVLLMNARPEMISRGQLQRVVKPKHPGGRPREFWTPNIIGPKYRIEREPLGGSGRKKRMHWRRGHFAQQPHGPHLQLRKTIWREPMLIGELHHDETKK